uniref:Uncharacterized protein n=1 Tax=Coturnix japonica TaxID=93934 RepID=A0A8C2Y953_COTJA
MTEINLRLYISVFPRNSTEVSVTVEGFMQATILTRALYFSVLPFTIFFPMYSLFVSLIRSTMLLITMQLSIFVV